MGWLSWIYIYMWIMILLVATSTALLDGPQYMSWRFVVPALAWALSWLLSWTKWYTSFTPVRVFPVPGNDPHGGAIIGSHRSATTNQTWEYIFVHYHVEYNAALICLELYTYQFLNFSETYHKTFYICDLLYLVEAKGNYIGNLLP